MSYFYNNNSIYINMIFQLQRVCVCVCARIQDSIAEFRSWKQSVSGICFSFDIKYYINVSGNGVLNMLVQNVCKEHKIKLTF
jgi:hypothetical protein